MEYTRLSYNVRLMRQISFFPLTVMNGVADLCRADEKQHHAERRKARLIICTQVGLGQQKPKEADRNAF